MTDHARYELRCLNVGCGDRPIADTPEQRWVNVDIRPRAGVVERDLRRGLPYEDETFDRVLCDNVLEHFASEDAIHLLNEMCRVLKVGGVASIVVPTAHSQGAFQDPTHKSFWVPRSCLYWNQYTTPYGGVAVGITANFEPLSVELRGDKAAEEFVEFTLRREPASRVGHWLKKS